jgi:hypothetical protein
MGLTLKRILAAMLLGAALTSGCTVAKVTGQAAALPFKGAYHGTKLASKGVYYSGKGAYHVGKGAYEVGKVPVKIADGVLDTATRTVTLTVLTLNTAGRVTALSRDIAAAQLYTELAALETSHNVLQVVVDVAS